MSSVTGTSSQATSAGHTARRLSPLLIAIIVVAVIGLADASYLTYEHYTGLKSLACFGKGAGGHSSCYTVQTSVWSKIDGVPVALLGVIGYVMLLASLFLRGDLGRAAGFGVALIGFLFSAYLTYREAHSIHHYCEYCLTSAGCLTVLMVLTGIRFVRGTPAT